MDTGLRRVLGGTKVLDTDADFQFVLASGKLTVLRRFHGETENEKAVFQCASTLKIDRRSRNDNMQKPITATFVPFTLEKTSATTYTLKLTDSANNEWTNAAGIKSRTNLDNTAKVYNEWKDEATKTRYLKEIDESLREKSGTLTELFPDDQRWFLLPHVGQKCKFVNMDGRRSPVTQVEKIMPAYKGFFNFNSEKELEWLAAARDNRRFDITQVASIVQMKGGAYAHLTCCLFWKPVFLPIPETILEEGAVEYLTEAAPVSEPEAPEPDSDPYPPPPPPPNNGTRVNDSVGNRSAGNRSAGNTTRFRPEGGEPRSDVLSDLFGATNDMYVRLKEGLPNVSINKNHVQLVGVCVGIFVLYKWHQADQARRKREREAKTKQQNRVYFSKVYKEQLDQSQTRARHLERLRSTFTDVPSRGVSAVFGDISKTKLAIYSGGVITLGAIALRYLKNVKTIEVSPFDSFKFGPDNAKQLMDRMFTREYDGEPLQTMDAFRRKFVDRCKAIYSNEDFQTALSALLSDDARSFTDILRSDDINEFKHVVALVSKRLTSTFNDDKTKGMIYLGQGLSDVQQDMTDQVLRFVHARQLVYCDTVAAEWFSDKAVLELYLNGVFAASQLSDVQQQFSVFIIQNEDLWQNYAVFMESICVWLSIIICSGADIFAQNVVDAATDQALECTPGAKVFYYMDQNTMKILMPTSADQSPSGQMNWDRRMRRVYRPPFQSWLRRAYHLSVSIDEASMDGYIFQRERPFNPAEVVTDDQSPFISFFEPTAVTDDDAITDPGRLETCQTNWSYFLAELAADLSSFFEQGDCVRLLDSTFTHFGINFDLKRFPNLDPLDQVPWVEVRNRNGGLYAAATDFESRHIQSEPLQILNQELENARMIELITRVQKSVASAEQGTQLTTQEFAGLIGRITSNNLTLADAFSGQFGTYMRGWLPRLSVSNVLIFVGFASSVAFALGLIEAEKNKDDLREMVQLAMHSGSSRVKFYKKVTAVAERMRRVKSSALNKFIGG